MQEFLWPDAVPVNKANAVATRSPGHPIVRIACTRYGDEDVMVAECGGRVNMCVSSYLHADGILCTVQISSRMTSSALSVVQAELCRLFLDGIFLGTYLAGRRAKQNRPWRMVLENDVMRGSSLPRHTKVVINDTCMHSSYVSRTFHLSIST